MTAEFRDATENKEERGYSPAQGILFSSTSLSNLILAVGSSAIFSTSLSLYFFLCTYLVSPG